MWMEETPAEGSLQPRWETGRVGAVIQAKGATLQLDNVDSLQRWFGFTRAGFTNCA